jgi:hypothetical protein
MTNRRLFTRLPTLAFALGVAVSLPLHACATDGEDEGSDGASSDDTGSGNEDEGNDGDGNDGDGEDDGGASCADACEQLSGCGVPTADCLAICGAGASGCANCLADSSSCGEDCVSACEGGGETGDSEDSGSTTDDPPQPHCTKTDECGISQECVACELNDSEGWCEFADECNFDSDCGSGRVCGYNVETSDYRCLSAQYCS